MSTLILPVSSDAPYDCSSSGTPDMRPLCDHAEHVGAQPCGRYAVAWSQSQMRCLCAMHARGTDASSWD